MGNPARHRVRRRAAGSDLRGHQRVAGLTSGMSIAIFDEAFSKMDGKNQRQMMGFYKDLGLQIVIAARFEKWVAVLEHMQTIVEIDRIGERSRRRWFCSRSALDANSWA
jgi:energy-coupling factor transporter ATP-binding protein EcfA2